MLYPIKECCMKPFAKLIHNTHLSYLPTAFSAQYFGMPNGRIYLVYSRSYEVDKGRPGMEFVFAVHKDFYYNYELETVIPIQTNNDSVPVFAESIDKPDSQIHIFKIQRNLNSFGEAQILINQKAQKMKSYNLKAV